jgi:hypothetical protein
MSELANTSNRSQKILWQLLNTASAFILVGAVGAATGAKAADQDNDRPTVWIELGGSLQRVDMSEEKYKPSFILSPDRPGPETIDPLNVGHLPRHSFDGEGKITFQPEGSSWKFSAGVRYGRSQAHQHAHQQSYPTAPLVPGSQYRSPIYQYVVQFIDAEKASSESHGIVDFQAGKDVGLGMFGAGSSSVISAGVRFAQFNSKTSTSFGSDPDATRSIKSFVVIPGVITAFGISNAFYHTHLASAVASRSFRGLGPSLAWNASAPVLGNTRDGQFAIDWGVNAALLFGRQKADVHHQSTVRYHHGKYGYNPRITSYPDTSPDKHRSHSVTVPNIGGFAGFTFQLQNFKVSAGYRADFFFGAMDGGIDSRKTENQNFYGPFATISFGLGG